MKIAIHHRPGSFSDRWIEYCINEKISYKLVNCYQSDIISQLSDCDALMWHHHHTNYRDVLFAKQLIYSLMVSGMKVFPDFNTSWHFDDKVGQKYLLESIDAPLVSSNVFYNKNDALEWVNKTSFPKVFKLRSGSGATNVKLVSSKEQAKKMIRKAFGKGFVQMNLWESLKERYRWFKQGSAPFSVVINGLASFFIRPEYSKFSSREKGYIYFQDFIPNNKFDIRVVVIGERAVALKRWVREGDFRASGSRNASYEKEEIDERCIKIAFEVNESIQAQSIGFDFVFDNNTPLIIEIGYGFPVVFFDKSPGYWDKQLKWHNETFNPQEWMIEDLITSVKKQTI